MAKKKISGLPAGSALNGTELVPIVQTGTTKRITTQDIANLGNASGVEGSGTINRLPKFTASSTIGNSAFFDDGTNQGTETTTAVNRFIMSANASIAKIFSFRSGNLPRWAFRVDGTESGANAGADLAIRRYDDAGTFIDAPMTMDRSDGTISVLKDATINGVRIGRGAGSIASNTAVGFEAGYSNTSSGGITAIGYQTLRLNTGSNNTAVGFSAMVANTTGGGNTAVGREALKSNTSGANNVGFGIGTLELNTTASNNVAIGYAALNSNVTGLSNTALGSAALVSNTASNNTAVGFESAYSNTSGQFLTAIGYRSLRSQTTATNNTSIGYDAMYNTTTGGENVAVGVSALTVNVTGGSNTVIGTNAQSTNFDSCVVLGRDASATASNQFVVGSASYPAGIVNAGVLAPTKYWGVKINGTNYNILIA